MKRLAVLAACAVALGAAAAAPAARTSKQASTSKSVTFRLVEKQVGFNFVDNPPKAGRDEPPLIGDTFSFTSELLTRAGKHAGNLNATCTVTSGGRNSIAVCTGMMGLRGGQIAVQALVWFANQGATTIAVIGGTGIYEGVTGSVSSQSRSDSSPYSDDTIHLIWR